MHGMRLEIHQPPTKAICCAAFIWTWLVSGSETLGNDCLGALSVTGDDRLVRYVDAWRRERETRDDSIDACTPRQVVIRKNADGDFALTLLENEHALYTRTVTEKETTIVLIESWLDESAIEGPVSSHAEADDMHAEADDIPTPSDDGAQDDTDTPPPRKGQEEALSTTPGRRGGIAWRNAIHLACLFWLGFDGSTWLGADLDGCRRLGPICLGMLARYGYDFHVTGESIEQKTLRHAAALLVTVDVPIAWDVLQLTGGAGLGGGLVYGARKEQESEATLTTGVFGSFQLECYLLLGIQLSRHVSFRFGPRIGGSLGRHAGIETINEYKMAIQPSGFFRFSIGGQFGW